MASTPKTLLDAVRYFADLDVANEYFAAIRWPDGPVCPACNAREYSYLSTRRLWKCKGCKKQYSVRVGTIFEDSPLGLDKWLPAVWLAANSKNGISSHELARALGITQKSAWFMLHRIRLAMQTGTFDKLSGHIEVDETFIGGLARNMHRDVRKRKIHGTGVQDKTAILGMRERGGQIRAAVVPHVDKRNVYPHIYGNVERGSNIYTDTLNTYKALGADFTHATVDHAQAYVVGQVHTNGLENFWSLMKRGLHGTYISVQPFHLFRYLDERCFTYNQRKLTDRQRFDMVLCAAAGKRLTFREATGKA